MIKKSRSKQTELLLEIGTEEIPWTYLELLRSEESLVNLVKAALDQEGFQYGGISGYQTPRRIVLHIQDLSPYAQKNEVIIGPKKEICYDSDGKPTPTLEGFLKSKQETIKRVGEENGRIVIRKHIVIPARDYLKGQLPGLIRFLNFPKMMRWNEDRWERDRGEFVRFPRPIRWLLCLYNGEILPLELGSLRADRKTYGSRPNRTPKRIRRFEDYLAFLKKEGILLEECTLNGEGDRKRFIRSRLKSKLQKLGGFSERLNETLLNEVTNLVEKPVLFSGHFDKKYLKLPKEVLIASMSKYQRLFSVEDRKGELLPCFVACANGSPSIAKVKKNYEHVLNARLEDADFFFGKDTKRPFPQHREKLKLLIYHQKLGTMYDKSERMKKLAAHLVQTLPFEAQSLLRSCELAKNDLVTEMVKEFPSLQGIVGSYYARRSGEVAEVALAIREQYLPKSDISQEFLPAENRVPDVFPKSPLGNALSFVEKLDHVVGCFYGGESPTGSSDPYGLRRAANALFKIILSQRWKFSLEEMIKVNSELLDRSLTVQEDRTAKLSTFLRERLKGIFKEEGFREDLIEAVVADIDHAVDMHEKLSALKEMMKRHPGDFLAAFKVVERTHNILKPIQLHERERIGEVKEDLFQEEVEKSLWKIYNDEKRPIQKLIEQSAWTQASAHYGRAFAETLHQFFEKVLVNVEDQDIRRNRLAMMKEINGLYTQSIADLSKLIMGQGPKTL